MSRRSGREPPGRWHRRWLSATRLRGSGASAAAAAGIGITLATFGFQTAQVWVDEGTHTHTLRWLFPPVVAALVAALTLCLYLLYWILRTTAQPSPPDPYRLYVDGVLAYGKRLHEEQRDPAVLRLRDNASLTLHVLGFHEARVTLGSWALESAQFVDDKLATISILIDDLGWANYLLGNEIAVANIEKAVRFAEQLPAGFGEPQRSLLLAKAYRHLGVIRTESMGLLQEQHFDRAAGILAGVAELAPRDVRTNVAHLSYAQALAIASMLDVNVSGAVRQSDTEGTRLLEKALALTRTAREGFRAEEDQGRHAKSLVLEVRLLEALRQDTEAEQLAPLRDRAVAASVWARPAGAAFITGR